MDGLAVRVPLLGKDQLAVAGKSQVVFAAHVLDDQFAFARQQAMTGNAANRGCWRMVVVIHD